MHFVVSLLKSIKWKVVFLCIAVKDIVRFYHLVLSDFLHYRQKIILVCRMEALGDVICTIPLARQLRKNHKDCRLLFLTTSYCSEILQSSDACDAIAIVRTKHFYPHFKLFGIISKIYKPRTEDERGLPVSRRHLYETLAQSCKVILEDSSITLQLSELDRRLIAERFRLDHARWEGKSVVVINCGPTWKVREWPAGHWQELIDRIYANYNVIIFQLGVHVSGQKNVYDSLTGTINLSSRLTIKELIGLIAHSDLLVSIDSGPVHIARAVGTPVLELLGALGSEISLPNDGISRGVTADVPCLGCHHQDPIGHWKSGCPHGIRCMAELSPLTVFEEFRVMADDLLPQPISRR